MKTKIQTQEDEVMKRVRQVVAEKYPRKLPVLARKLGWDKGKLWRMLYEGKSVRFGELVTLCMVLGLPLSTLLHQVGA